MILWMIHDKKEGENKKDLKFENKGWGEGFIVKSASCSFRWPELIRHLPGLVHNHL